MKELDLQEDDLDDVVFAEDDAPAEEDLRWMILARVHMDNGFRKTSSRCNSTAWVIGRELHKGDRGTSEVMLSFSSPMMD